MKPKTRHQLPSVDRLLGDPTALVLLERYGRKPAVDATRASLTAARMLILQAGT